MEYINIPYHGDFKSDIENEIKNILSDVCNTTFDGNNSQEKLSIVLDELKVEKPIVNVIDNYWVPIINTAKTSYTVNSQYHIEATLNDDKKYKQQLEVNASHSDISTPPLLAYMNTKYELKYCERNQPIFNADINSSLATLYASGSIGYELFDSTHNLIMSGKPVIDTKVDQSIEVQDLSEYNILRMLTGDRRLISSLAESEYLDSIHSDNNQLDKSKNSDGMLSFMVYDLAKFIIQNP